MNLVKYANDCLSETYCYIEVVFLGSAKFRWNRDRERRGLNHVLIWFAEVTCLSDSEDLVLLGIREGEVRMVKEDSKDFR